MIEKEYHVTMADTDASGRIYFGAVPEWFHGLWEEYLEQKKLPISKLLNGEFHLPVVHMEFNYKAALTMGDVVVLRILKIERSKKSFTVFYQASKSSTLALEGKITHVSIDVKMGRAIDLPGVLNDIF